MKLLFDQNLSHKLCDRLADIFPDSQQVRQANLQSADDQTIWRYAKSNDFVIVSHDVDFANLAALLGSPPKVIWLRCGNQATDSIERLLRENAAGLIAFGASGDIHYIEVFKR